MDLAAEAADAGADLIATGDMGIGNTTAASAITAVMTGASPEHSTGPGTGRTPEELRRKVTVVRRALEHNAPDPGDPLGVLAGVMLGAACRRRAVVLWIMRGPLQPQVELLW